MRERVSVLGGRLDAGPGPGGGFAVRARAAAAVVSDAARHDASVRVSSSPTTRSWCAAGFAMIIDAQPDLAVVGEAADGDEAVSWPAGSPPTSCSWTSACRGSTASRPPAGWPGADVADPVKVVILTTFDLDEYVFEALRAGASGFLLKDVRREDLVHAVRVVAAGEALLAPSMTRRLIEDFARRPRLEPGVAWPPDRPPDAPRAGGARAHRAGPQQRRDRRRAVVGEATVKTHVGRVLMKLGLRDRVQAVIYAYEAGLVGPDWSDRGLTR